MTSGRTPRQRVLHVGAEIYPLVKTGGLGDVLGALPPALAERGTDVRVLVPGYPAIVGALEGVQEVARLGPAFGAASLVVRLGRLARVAVPAYVLDAPALFDRPGNPYVDADGSAWRDNPLRFGALSWVAAHLGLGDIDRAWRPTVVHGHDWHAGLACAYLAQHPLPRCRSVFTIHNLAFHGLFERRQLGALQLDDETFVFHGLEFHGQGSAIKAGLQYAARVTTVSPTYAREIQTPEFGCGLEAVVAHRRNVLSGILNGVDYTVWNPAADRFVEQRFDPAGTPQALRAGKARAKQALQRETGLAVAADRMLIGVVSRLTAQKGIDLLVQALPQVIGQGAQLVLLGTGDAALEAGLTALAQRHPDAVAVKLGYDEAFAHRIMAGSDVIAVPSRFEPCGLTQLYALRYAALPLVRAVGGLADTVVDATDTARADNTATGFAFHAASAGDLVATIRRALRQHAAPDTWLAMMRTAVAQDFSWGRAAAAYEAIYAALGDDAGSGK